MFWGFVKELKFGFKVKGENNLFVYVIDNKSLEIFFVIGIKDEDWLVVDIRGKSKENSF